MDHHPKPKTAYCYCICQLLRAEFCRKLAFPGHSPAIRYSEVILPVGCARSALGCSSAKRSRSPVLGSLPLTIAEIPPERWAIQQLAAFGIRTDKRACINHSLWPSWFRIRGCPQWHRSLSNTFELPSNTLPAIHREPPYESAQQDFVRWVELKPEPHWPSLPAYHPFGYPSNLLDGTRRCRKNIIGI
jgi:hypothetical protein